MRQQKRTEFSIKKLSAGQRHKKSALRREGAGVWQGEGYSTVWPFTFSLKVSPKKAAALRQSSIRCMKISK